MLRSLLIAPIYASSLMTGGGQRTFHIYRSLALLGAVDLVLVSEEACADLEAGLATIRREFPEAGRIVVQRSTAQFLVAPAAQAGRVAQCLYAARRVVQALRPRRHFYRPSANAAAELTALIEANGYDVLVGRYLQPTALSGALEQRRVPVVVDLDDLDEMVLESRLRSRTTSPIRKLVLGHQARQVKRVARRLRAQCRHVFAASDSDRVFVDHPSSSILPNIPFCEKEPDPIAFDAPLNQEAVVLFVGSHGHRVNREGLLHFAVHCWPSILARVPGARLRVVGSGHWAAERDRIGRAAGIELVGAVDDLKSEYAAAAFCIVPLFEGSGTKIKVLEALLYGRAVVAASHSARGYDELIGAGIVSAASDAALADECVRLLADRERREAMAAAGYRYVKANYSFEAVFQSIRLGLASAQVAIE